MEMSLLWDEYISISSSSSYVAQHLVNSSTAWFERSRLLSKRGRFNNPCTFVMHPSSLINQPSRGWLDYPIMFLRCLLSVCACVCPGLDATVDAGPSDGLVCWPLHGGVCAVWTHRAGLLLWALLAHHQILQLQGSSGSAICKTMPSNIF